MENVHTNPQLFNYQPAAPLPHKLDDYRIVRGSYGDRFSGKSSRQAWLAAIVVLAVAGTAVGVSVYSDDNAVLTSSPALAPTHSTPLGPSVPARTEVPAAPATKEVSTIEPVNAPGKIQAPSAPSVATPFVEPISPVKAKPRAAAKAEAVTKPIAPARVNQVVTPQDAIPVSPPAPIVEEPPVIPTPTPVTTPIVPPMDPPK